MNRVSRGFTLIELLVVVAIIAVLMAILMPGLNNARVQSRTVACGSNLRQIGTGFFMYAQDSANNNGFWPSGRWDATLVWPKNMWYWKIDAYLSNRVASANPSVAAQSYDILYNKVYRCPGKLNWNGRPNAGAGVTDMNRVSYAMNSWDMPRVDGNWNQNVYPRTDTNGHVAERYIKDTMLVTPPGSTMLVMDCNTGGCYIDNPNIVYTVSAYSNTALFHGNADNVLFADYHVERVPMRGLDSNLVRK